MQNSNKEEQLIQNIDVTQLNTQELVNTLYNNHVLQASLIEAINISKLKEKLTIKFSFEDLQSLNSYCHEIFLKVDEVSFKNVQDFAVNAINNNLASIDEILSMTRKEFGSAVLDNDTNILNELFPKESNKKLITPFSTHLKIDGQKGSWFVIDTAKINNKQYYLLENEIYGSKDTNIIVNNQCNLILEKAKNGFDDLYSNMLDNPLANIEKSIEQNYNQIDGIINNVEERKDKKPSILQELKHTKVKSQRKKDKKLNNEFVL